VDTHLLLWATASSRRLPKEARRLLESQDNQLYCSAASLWEIAIKLTLRRPGFQVDLGRLRSALSEMGFEELPVTGAHAERLVALPQIHKDPFDRILIAQSLCEPMVLLTNDEVLGEYSGSVRVTT